MEFSVNIQNINNIRVITFSKDTTDPLAKHRHGICSQDQSYSFSIDTKDSKQLFSRSLIVRQVQSSLVPSDE